VSPVLRVVGYTLSALLHVGAGALIIAWSAPDWTRPLFVDLVEPPEPPAAVAPRAADDSMAHAAPRFLHQAAAEPGSRAVAPRTPGSPVGPRPAPSAPAPPSSPSPQSVSPSSAAPSDPVSLSGPQVGIAPPPSPAPEPAAIEPAPLPSTPPVSSPPGGHVVASEPGAIGPAAGRSLAGIDARTTGSPGTSLALASRGGEPGGPGPEYGPYLRRFRERVADALVYPLGARREGLKGTVELYVRLEADGRVSDVRVVRSSSHEILDQAALETIRRVGPLPFPESLPRRPLLIRIPLVFQLQ